jgi:hypothetical protein
MEEKIILATDEAGAAELRKAVDKARAEIKAGKFVDHKRVMAWLADLASGRLAPKPKP